MDTMAWTKLVGAGCAALLIFLFLHWGAEVAYHVGGKDDHHAEKVDDDHGEEHGSALAWIVVEEKGDLAEVEEEGPDFMTVFASADIDKGSKVFSKCKACHKLEDGANNVGPHLWKIVDRPFGTAEGFSYSAALLEKASMNWSVEELNAFLENPKAYVPGTKMVFKGLPKVADRANLIAYLQTIGE